VSEKMVSLAANASASPAEPIRNFGVTLPVYEAKARKNNGKIAGFDRAMPCA
jgi:hypothetical protein